MRDFAKRFGGFLLMVGAVLLALFFLSDSQGQANGWYLLIGVLLAGIGGSILWQRREKPLEEPVRFRLLRRVSRRDKGKDKIKKLGKKQRRRRGKDDNEDEKEDF